MYFLGLCELKMSLYVKKDTAQSLAHSPCPVLTVINQLLFPFIIIFIMIDAQHNALHQVDSFFNP